MRFVQARADAAIIDAVLGIAVTFQAPGRRRQRRFWEMFTHTLRLITPSFAHLDFAAPEARPFLIFIDSNVFPIYNDVARMNSDPHTPSMKQPTTPGWRIIGKFQSLFSDDQLIH
jgi:hypothetical protein